LFSLAQCETFIINNNNMTDRLLHEAFPFPFPFCSLFSLLVDVKQ